MTHETRQIISIIGTIHADGTPEHELIEVLEHLSPDQLFVEIAQNDLVSCEKYPAEMQAAYHWAQYTQIPVYGFDPGIETFSSLATEEMNTRATHEQLLLLKSFSWKDANQLYYAHKLQIPLLNDLIDRKKEGFREGRMIKIIRDMMFQSGHVVIITGVAHLVAFERAFPSAVFPLRPR